MSSNKTLWHALIRNPSKNKYLSLIINSSITERINICLDRYYDLKNASYINQDGDTHFNSWFDENGYDSIAVEEEFEQHYEEAAIVDFDDDFPTDKTGVDRLKEIFEILYTCYKDPIAFFKDQIIYQQTMLFDGYIRIEIVNYFKNHHNKHIPQDIANLCKIFYDPDTLWLYGCDEIYDTSQLRYISQKCRQLKYLFMEHNENDLQWLEKRIMTFLTIIQI